MFALVVSIEDECLIVPHTLTITEVGDFARAHMRTKGVDLSVEKYNLWVVSPLQKDVAKPGAAYYAKYRAIVMASKITDIFTPGVSASDPCSFRRMPHVLFAKIKETKAPMEQRERVAAALQ